MFSEHLDLGTLNSLFKTTRLGKAPGWSNEVWQSIESTNTRALELARQGAPEGVVVAARLQTAGRGRLGRTWISPEDCGLYFSIVLRPELGTSSLPLLSFAAGVAAVEGIARNCGMAVQLKWVNDIVFGGKKIGGILAETTSTAADNKQALAAVIGIGLNLKRPQALPEDLAVSASWLEDIVNQPIDANQLAAAIIERLESSYSLLLQGNKQELLSLWKHHAVTLGKQIKVVRGAEEFEGMARDIANDGALQVVLPSGETVVVHAADVSIRNADGSYA